MEEDVRNTADGGGAYPSFSDPEADRRIVEKMPSDAEKAQRPTTPAWVKRAPPEGGGLELEPDSSAPGNEPEGSSSAD